MKDEYAIVMKVGPHSNMSLEDIIESKIDEEKIHGFHFWGYSGVFCQPKKVQEFAKEYKNKTGKNPKLYLIETKSKYNSSIGLINYYSKDGINYEKFNGPVQLQGAQFSFVAKNIEIINNFNIKNYNVVYGKNNGRNLEEHLKFKVNKSFVINNGNNLKGRDRVLVVELVPPYAIWLKDEINY